MGVKSQEGPTSAWGSSGGGAAGGQGDQGQEAMLSSSWLLGGLCICVGESIFMCACWQECVCMRV